MIQLKKVCKIYGEKYNITSALNNVNLTIESGETIAVCGASGSGKTTLLNIMSTIDKATVGEVYFAGNRIDNLNQKEASNLRLHEFGFVFQKYYLMPTLNVYDNICMPSSVGKMSIDIDYSKELIELLGITDKLTEMPGHLSGGQQQRVAIARALLHKPKVLFADEPTGNLDSANSLSVINLLLSSAKRFNQTLIYVTHNTELAKLADRVITIKDGSIDE